MVADQSINQYVFQDFTRILLTGYMVNHSNNPRTDIGKPVFMTDLQMHWYGYMMIFSKIMIQYLAKQLQYLGIENENENEKIDKIRK